MQTEPLKYKGELQLVQKLDKSEQVAQLTSQVLHILLSETSPYSFVFVHNESQLLVILLPQRGLGHAPSQTDDGVR